MPCTFDSGCEKVRGKACMDEHKASEEPFVKSWADFQDT